MKSNLKAWHGVIAVISIVVGFMAGFVSPVWAENSNPDVIPLNANAYGKTYGEWSANWWQWAYSLPVNKNPFFDETGCANGAQGQSGPVWFLTGVFNDSHTAVRDCTVPAGKALFFPVLNNEWDYFFPPLPLTFPSGQPELFVGYLRDASKESLNTVTKLNVEFDGHTIRNLFSYRVKSPVFGIHLPDSNVQQFFGFTAPRGEYGPFVGEGYYIMLAPFSRGKHDLHFHGELPGFTLDITYHITVVGPSH